MNFSPTYCMSYCGRQVAPTVWSGVENEQGVNALYTEGMCIPFCYRAFCINFMYIIGRRGLNKLSCFAILLAQQAVQYVKQSKQSALISSNVASCCWDISLIELSKHCYCSNYSNIHQLTHKYNHSTLFIPSHTVLLYRLSTYSTVQALLLL